MALEAHTLTAEQSRTASDFLVGNVTNSKAIIYMIIYEMDVTIKTLQCKLMSPWLG